MGTQGSARPEAKAVWQSTTRDGSEAETLATELVAQMEANDDWPVTLRWFVEELATMTGLNDRVGRS